MNLANTVRAAGPGFLVGALTGILLSELGVLSCLPGGVSTISAALALGAVGGLLGYFRRLGFFALGTGLLLFAYLVIAMSPLMGVAAHSWVRSDSSGQPVVAVISLSSSVQSNSEIDGHALDRLLTAMELAETEPSARLLTTRIVVRGAGQPVSSDSGQRELVRLAGLEARWSVVDSVLTTHDEATRARRLFADAARPRIAVVTSPMHTRRACAVFEKAGFEVRCVPAREHNAITDDPRSAHDRLAAFREYLYERLGWIKYRASGWVAYSST